MKNYFKKFGIMFVMLLALLGVGVIQNGTAANAATVGHELLQPEAGWTRYDNNDSMIKYSGIWTAGGGLHYTTNKDTSVTFKFYGSKLRIISFCRTDGDYASDVKINIDGVYSSINMGVSNDGPNVLVFENSALTLGNHMVTISNPNFLVKQPFWFIKAIDTDGKLLPYDNSISLDKTSMNLTVGDIQQLTATTTPAGVGVSWTSSDISIATVDSNGKVTAGSIAGTCTITATTNDGSNLSASCIVTVTPKAIEPIPNPTPTPTPNPDLEYIVNTAHAKGDNTNNAGGGVSIIYMGLAEAQLSVVKTADVSAVYVGDNFTYTIVVTNTSSKPAKAVVVKDSAPNHIQFIVSGITTTQGNVDSSSTSSNVVVNVGDIPALGTVTIKIPATVIL